jgi:hypothetical protein
LRFPSNQAGDCSTRVDSLDIDLCIAYAAIKIRPETFCYLLRVIARPSCCAFWRSRCPPWSQGCSARPPIAAGVWSKHLDGGFPVPGARFGGLKSVPFGLVHEDQSESQFAFCNTLRPTQSVNPNPTFHLAAVCGLRWFYTLFLFYMPNPLFQALSTQHDLGGVLWPSLFTWRRPALGQQRVLFQNFALVTAELRQ